MKKLLPIYLFFILVASCTEPFEVDIDDFESLLVVEGFVSTENAVQSIKLTKTARYGSIFEGIDSRIQPEENAIVIVRDDLGNNTTFFETEPGIYESDGAFSAIVGRSYNLLVELSNGDSYISLPETVTEPVAIESLDYEFAVKFGANDEQRTGFDLNVNFTDDADRDNFYLWRMAGVHEFLTFPDRHVTPVPPPGFGLMETPKDCCATCWRIEDFDSDITVANDNLFDGNSLSENVLFVQDNGLRFSQGNYLVSVRQYSLSSDAYDFLSLVANQIGIDGDIFDPPPATIRGNMISLTNPGEDVIGYFWAASVAIDTVTLETANLEIRQGNFEINDDCRLTPGATTEQPSFWEE